MENTENSENERVRLMPTVEVDRNTMRALEFAARIAGTTPGGVVAQLVETTITSEQLEQSATEIDVFADYEGHRTHGRYDPTTRRIDITSGPLAGQSFKTPSAAACAVVAHYKPSVHPNRNGWDFWYIEGSGEPLQTIR
jgi:hypothetical protein